MFQSSKCNDLFNWIGSYSTNNLYTFNFCMQSVAVTKLTSIVHSVTAVIWGKRQIIKCSGSVARNFTRDGRRKHFWKKVAAGKHSPREYFDWGHRITTSLLRVTMGSNIYCAAIFPFKFCFFGFCFIKGNFLFTVTFPCLKKAVYLYFKLENFTQYLSEARFKIKIYSELLLIC